MMNKLKTARVHLLRFLFILPLLAVVLISFRRQKQDTIGRTESGLNQTNLLRDTIPGSNEPNEKGYIISVSGNKPSSATVTVKDKNGKLVERIPFSKWKDNEKYYEDKYGEYPPPPPPAQPPTPPEPPQPMEMPENVKKIDVNNNKATVVLKDGTEEKYDLSKPEEKAKFEKKYGEVIPPPPPPPPRPRSDDEITAVQEVNVSHIASDIEITDDHKAHLRLKDGTVEEYNLASPKEKKVFEEKYGKVIEIGKASELTKDMYYTVPKIPTAATSETPVADITMVDGQAVIAPRAPHPGVTLVDDEAAVVAGKEDLLFTITKKTTQEQLEILIKEMKEKGVTLRINKTEYKDGILVHVEGTVKLEDSHATFSGTDFSKVVLSTVRSGDRTLIKVDIHVSKQMS